MKKIIYIFLLVSGISTAFSQTHPSLTITKEGLQEIKANLGRSELFDRSLADIKLQLEEEMAKGIDVPVPKDMAGGYTHETHRKNYSLLEAAGYLFQITGEEKYADFVKQGLLKYAKLYPTLGKHPSKKSYTPGKLFWQCLNDANWLVSVSQAYDCIYHRLNVEERKMVEGDLFRPFADFLSIENPHFFNRIHNHSTWGCAGVGMIGLVMNDQELVNRALFGISSDGISSTQKDNDGALIKAEGQEKSGFFAQIDGLFSPDGLYSEGAYYHRYGIYPFLIFAVSIQNTMPEHKIFAYRDSLLLKSVDALLNQSTSKGDFFPFNDAQKGMSIYNTSLISAVDIAYYYGARNPELLSIAEKQGSVTPDQAGMKVSLDMDKKKPFSLKSKIYRDGIDGKSGGIGILRADEDINLVYKFGTHGMGHGHFDQLSYSFYQNGEEVVQDYGMARFVNIEQKAGGVYLPENTTFAKQTVGHNTVVVNGKTQYNGNTDLADRHSPALRFVDISNPKLQVISAVDSSAYEGVKQERTLLLINDSQYFENPLVIDLFYLKNELSGTYDLPLYYQGQLLNTNFHYSPATDELRKLGESNGYQHIWKEAGAVATKKHISFSSLSNNVFYTFSSAVSLGDSLFFGRTGATDPNFNLRRDPLFLIRKKSKGSVLFANVIESHGSYTPVTEKAIEPYGTISELRIIKDNEDYSAVVIKTKENTEVLVAVSHKNDALEHVLETEAGTFKWKGNYLIKTYKN